MIGQDLGNIEVVCLKNMTVIFLTNFKVVDWAVKGSAGFHWLATV